MSYTPDQITYEPDWRFAPWPGNDVHWFRVELGVHRTGWAYVPASVPIPSVEWVAAELTYQDAALGRALEGMLASSGFQLARAPRPDEDASTGSPPAS